MLKTFITPQKQIKMQKFMPTTAMGGGDLLWHSIMAKRENAIHRVIMRSAVC